MFVVCGESLIDVFADRETPTGMALDARVGGSPFNVAIGLARLAQPVSFLGAVSRDFLGDRLMRALREEGVQTASTVRVDARTTLGLVGTDAQGVPSYSFYGEHGADRALQSDMISRLPAETQAIHVGSFAMVVEPIASTLRTLVGHERERALISYDPNIRLNVEPDVTRWRATLEWMLPRTDLLKISEEDLALLRPGIGREAFAADAVAHGVRLVVVTRGSEGAQGWTATQSAVVPAGAVPVVDTVGAGDSFQAALLTWLAEQGARSREALVGLEALRLRAAMEFAVRAASITCSRRGADLPRRAEIGV